MGRNLWTDLKTALRRFRRQPLVTFAVLLTLGVVIGAEALLFTLVQKALLEPLPFERADRLAVLSESSPSRGISRASVAADNFSAWRLQARSFEGIAAARSMDGSLEVEGRFESVRRARVTADFFHVLGVEPALGPGFASSEGDLQPEVMISHPLWQRLFQGDPGVLGKSLLLDGQSMIVVGVLPPRAELPRSAEVWTPHRFTQQGQGGGVRALFVVARLRDDVAALGAARSEVQALSALGEERNPDLNRGFGVVVESLSERLTERIRRPLILLFAAASLALFVGCLNLANLQLVRTVRRRGELGMRAALGARGFSLWRSMLVESALIACSGSLLGFSIAQAGGRVVAARVPELAALGTASLDASLVVAVVVLALFCTALLFLVPPLYFRSWNPAVVLPDETSRSVGSLRFGRWQSALLVLQVALSVPLLVGMAFLGANLLELQKLELGFQEENLVTSRIRYQPGPPQARLTSTQGVGRMVEDLERLPQVVAVTAGSGLPSRPSSLKTTFVIENRPNEPGESPPYADQVAVSGDYFSTFGIPVLHGRGVATSDVFGSPTVAVINQTLAERFFPGENPVGRRILMGSPEEFALYGKPAAWEIVGVVGDVLPMTGRPDPAIYLSAEQMPPTAVYVTARLRPDTALSYDAVQSRARAALGPVQAGRLQSMEEILADAAGRPEMQTFFLGAFALVSLGLLVICAYALVSHLVQESARSLGVCIALGAGNSQLLRLILRQTVRLCAAGLFFGVVLSWGSSRLMESATVLPARLGPLPILLAVLVIGAVIALAAWYPARQALKLDPKTLLMMES